MQINAFEELKYYIIYIHSMKHNKKQSHYKKKYNKKNTNKNTKKIKLVKNIEKSSKKILPKINQGLQKVGSTAKTVAVKSEPYLKKGISSIYGVLATGFNKTISKISSFTKSNKRSKTHKKRK
jgi:hypothetical protein